MATKKKAGRPKKGETNLDVKTAEGEKYLAGYKRRRQAVPSAAGLALALGTSRKTLYQWAGKHEGFADLMERIQATQESELINQGLTGEFNATITKLMLANHNYHEKVENTGTSVVGHVEITKDLDPKEASRRYKEFIKSTE